MALIERHRGLRVRHHLADGDGHEVVDIEIHIREVAFEIGQQGQIFGPGQRHLGIVDRPVAADRPAVEGFDALTAFGLDEGRVGGPGTAGPSDFLRRQRRFQELTLLGRQIGKGVIPLSWVL